VSSTIPAVVFDCNIFLQALINPKGAAGACKGLIDSGEITLFISLDVLMEVTEVLSRPRVRQLAPALTLAMIEAFLADITSKAILLHNVPEEFRFERDPKDEPYINLAIVARAKYLISRDLDLLDLMRMEKEESRAFRHRYPMLTILDPVAFLREMKKRTDPHPHQ
jgi:putative PIN family toxin of toxin-antitoxin system